MAFFETSDGIQLHYTDQGEGNPILCLPGLTRNDVDFVDFQSSFKPKARVIALTARGREPSQFDPNWQNYVVEREGQDTIELMDHLGIDRALFLGTSRGGLATMFLATCEKSRIAGAVLNDIGPELNFEGLERIVAFLGSAPSFATLEEATEILSQGFQAQFPDLSDERWRELTARLYRFDEKGAHIRYDPKLRDAVLLTPPDINIWPIFEALKGLPLGLIHGENSDLLTDEGVAMMRSCIPEMLYAKVPNRGHVPFLNELPSLDLIEKIFTASFP